MRRINSGALLQMDLIQQEIDYYKANRQLFLAKYDGLFLVIKGQQIIGVYPTKTQAYDQTIAQHEKGTFIIEHPIILNRAN